MKTLCIGSKHNSLFPLFLAMASLMIALLACSPTGIIGPTPTPVPPTATSTPVPFIAKPGKWSGQDVSFEVAPDGKIAVLNFTAHYISGGSLHAEYVHAYDVSVDPDGTFRFESSGPMTGNTYFFTGKFNSPTTASFTYGTETATVEWKSP